MKTWSISGRLLRILQGDLTRQDTDAIVNAANSRLAGGGGVDGAIHHAAGPAPLQAACKTIIANIGTLSPGRAVLTPGFALPARHIIHTVGPVWRGGDRDEPALLAEAYGNCLALAHAHGIHTVAFPAISCGAYGFPVDQAVPIALRQLVSGLETGLVNEIRMVLHGENNYRAWTETAPAFIKHPIEE